MSSARCHTCSSDWLHGDRGGEPSKRHSGDHRRKHSGDHRRKHSGDHRRKPTEAPSAEPSRVHGRNVTGPAGGTTGPRGAGPGVGGSAPPESVDDLASAVTGWGALVAARSAGGGWSAASLAEAMAGWRRLQRCCDAVGFALAEAADGLAAAGSGPPADVALAAEGSVTEATARVEAERARAAAGFPTVREAVAAGHVGADNLDVLVRTLDGLTSDEVAALRGRDDELAGVVVRLGPDSFRRWLRRMRDRIRADHGSGAAERARRDAFGRISPDRSRRGYRVSGWLPAPRRRRRPSGARRRIPAPCPPPSGHRRTQPRWACRQRRGRRDRRGCRPRCPAR